MRRSRRRRLGRALLAFGATGLALLIAAGALVLVSFSSIGDAATGLERQRTQLVAMLEPASSSLRDAARAAGNAGTSLQSSATAARDASVLTTQLAGSLDQLAALSNLDILGTRPFASAASSFTDTAGRSRSLAAGLVTTAAALDSNMADSLAVQADLGRLADQLDALRSDLGAGSAGANAGSPAAAAIGLARFVLIGLLTWLAVPALVALWLGWRWSRTEG